MSEATQNNVTTDNKSEATALSNPTRKQKPSKLAVQKMPPPGQYSDDEDEGNMSEIMDMAPVKQRGSRRMVPVHQSRIRDRPAKPAEKDSSLKIKIELDLEVEVEIYARVKGDVTIGLM